MTAVRASIALSAVTSMILVACGGGQEAPTGYDPSVPPSGAPASMFSTRTGAVALSMWTFPQPPRKGTNDVVFRVVDAAGASIDGLTVEVTPWMTAHGHGTSARAQVMSLGDGLYWATPVYLYMSGRWELRMSFSGAPIPDADAPDDAAPFFDIP